MSLQRANVLLPFIGHSSHSKHLCSLRIPNHAFPRSFQADGKSQAFAKGSEVMWKGNSGERSPLVEKTFSSQRCGPDWPISCATESCFFVVRCHRAWVFPSGHLANARSAPLLLCASCLTPLPEIRDCLFNYYSSALSTLPCA